VVGQAATLQIRVHSCAFVLNLKKQSQFARLWREIRSAKLEILNRQTTNPRKSAQSAVQSEKTKPISAKTTVSAFTKKDYSNARGRDPRENKANLPAVRAPAPAAGQARCSICNRYGGLDRRNRGFQY